MDWNAFVAGCDKGLSVCPGTTSIKCRGYN